MLSLDALPASSRGSESRSVIFSDVSIVVFLSPVNVYQKPALS